ncbi:hypothetical protein, partial [Endozoicomonas sp. YOMI1]|uniref:hypothetical protein n=1 Tax=Endozoicomonas sp. YOMI1 TaxID=2828739 RepID=UPI00214978D0
MSLPVKANFQLLNTPTDSNSLPSSKEDVNGIKSGKYTEYLCHGESEASSLVSSFYSNLGLTVRVVDVKKILAERTESNANTIQFRPFSCLFPGSKRVVVSPVSDLNEFAALLDLDGLVTVHKPIDDSVMEWAFKWDADTGQNGEARKKKSKKITDFATLKKKVEEMEWRDESLFPSWCSSGHLSPDGYSLHHSSLPKGVGNLNYPEIICRYNFDQTHCGYLLDFRREKSFFQIARFMENILRLETHGCAGQRPKPITLFLYDSYRGRLLSPLELDRTLVNKIADNVKVFARYARFSHQERELYNLLSQAGCDRFLRLLMNNIPESVRAVANAGQTIDVENIKKAIVNLEVSKVLAMLSEIDNELIARVGLPTTLMDQLIDHPIFTDKDFKNYHKSANNKHYLQYFDQDRLRRLMRTTFAAQGDICRALIKNNLFIPFIARGVYEPMVNPLVSCLLIANGSRTNFTESCFDVTTSLFPIMAAREFYREGLLTGAELKIIRHETLWQIVFDYPRNVITDPDKIIERFRKLVNTLSGFLAQHKQKSHPDDWVKQECREILSEPLYTIYLDEKASGVDLKKALEEGLSAQRYNDRQLMDYICFTIFSATGSCDDDLALIKFQNGYSFIPKCWVVNRFSTKDSSPDHWLEALLASPPIFDPPEMQRAGRYRTITREAGQHYYQNPHPGLAKNILARGIKPRYRECHGLDHALRTQLATEFLLEILTDFHPPFKELLKQHQLLQELLPIAELYHDAVAEVEA